MRAKDLMIGNYLSYNNLSYRVIQVTAGFDGDDSDSWTLENGEDNLGEPIPITPEFLDKNFERERLDVWGYDRWFYTNDFIEIYIYEFNDGTYKVEIENIEIVNYSEVIHICWIHELQNFLTLNGIDLEIKV